MTSSAYIPYSGIGSRETPLEILSVMTSAATRLASEGYSLRSGGALGADTAFYNGAMEGQILPEIYLPWKDFNPKVKWPLLTKPQPEAYEIARQFHPAWNRLSYGAKTLHARNAHQIMGRDVTEPVLSKLVICWTPGGKGGGGTGQALRMAHHYDIPVWDLGNRDDLVDVGNWLGLSLRAILIP